MKKRAHAQGTIEYLVIMAIVVVIGLIVVGMTSTFLDSSGGISSGIGGLSSIIGPISITETVVDSDGDGYSAFQNNSGETLVITKIALGGVDNNYNKTIAPGGIAVFELNNLVSGCTCSTPGETKTCIQIIYYTSMNGVSNSETKSITVDCVSSISTVQTTTSPLESDPPTVSLLGPADNNVNVSGTFNFLYSATDASNISFCELIIDGLSDQSDSTSPFDSFTKTFSTGKVSTWDVNCTDEHGNEGTSGEARSITYLYHPSARLAFGNYDSASNGSDATTEIVVDGSGNIYVAGSYVGDLNLGNDVSLEEVSANSNFFVAKYNSLGEAQWAKGPSSSAGNGGDWASGLFVDDSGNVYVGGTFYGDLNFGDATLLLDYDSQWSSDFFVAKYDSSGDLIFVINNEYCTNCNNDDLAELFVDADENIYIVGTYSYDLNLGGGFYLNELAVNPTSMDFFVAKYGSSGNIIWAKGAEPSIGNEIEYARDLFVDSSSNVYVVGDYTGDLNLGNGVLFNDSGSYAHFLAKYSAQGDLLFGKTKLNVPASGSTRTNAVVVDDSGNIYVGGSISNGDYTFASGISMSTINLKDFFLVKYNSVGTVQWLANSESSSNNYNELIENLESGSDGNIYLSGEFGANSTYADLNFGDNIFLSGYPNYNFFVAKYSPSGTPFWAKGTEYSAAHNLDYAYGIDVDSSNSVFITGYRSGDLNFGNSKYLEDYADNDFFVVKYN